MEELTQVMMDELVLLGLLVEVLALDVLLFKA
jgi:hypothetical protein